MAPPNKIPQYLVPGDPTFQQHYSQLINTVNSLVGYENGTIELAGHINMGGKRVMNVGSPIDATDALSSGVAEGKYSASVLQPQLEAGAATPLKSYKAINSATQREKISSFLNDLVSTPPNSNNIDPIVTSAGGSIFVTIPASKFNFADGSSRSFPSRSDTLSTPASYTISSWSISSGVATVNLSSTPSPPLVVSALVYISGTGVIDGSQKITNILSPTSFQFQTTATGSGASGTVATGGVLYYFITKRSPVILSEQLTTGSDTPYNRLTASTDGRQLVAVISVNSSGVVTTETAGGGTPSNNTANGGSRF